MRLASIGAAAIAASAVLFAAACSSSSQSASAQHHNNAAAQTASHREGFAGGNGAFGEDPVQPGAYQSDQNPGPTD
jgi:hypothetical protein